MATPRQHLQPSTSASASGIALSSSGDRIVPASVRTDGSIRKERKVRPGYTPVEDIARYRPPASRDSAPSPRPRAVPGLGASGLAALAQPPPRTGARAGGGRAQGAATPPRAAAVASWKTLATVEQRSHAGPSAGAVEGKGKDRISHAAVVTRAPVPRDEPRESWDASSNEGEDDERAGKAEGAPAAHGALGTSGGSRVPAVESQTTSTLEESERRARALRKKLRQAEQLRDRSTPLSAAERAKVDGVAALQDELAALVV
ncbi:hypothetical protein JCM9279_002631 [Rhodotorula babjevae]